MRTETLGIQEFERSCTSVFSLSGIQAVKTIKRHSLYFTSQTLLLGSDVFFFFGLFHPVIQKECDEGQKKPSGVAL